MKALNYNFQIESDKLISWIITLMIITLLYLLMIYIPLPESEPPREVVIDQIIDTKSIIKKVRDARKKDKDHLTTEQKKEKQIEPNKPKVPRPSNKIEISEIKKKNPKITKKTIVSNK